MSALTDKQIKNAKKADKDYKLADGGGLNLFVLATGTKSWRLRYRFDGKEKTLVIGNYPGVSLADARAEREAAKETLKPGAIPTSSRRSKKAIGKQKAAETFEVLARERHALQKPHWVEKHAADVLESLEKDVFPIIGKLPIRDIDAPRCSAFFASSSSVTQRKRRDESGSGFRLSSSTALLLAEPARIRQPSCVAPWLR